jgi:tetratricopeptide (TPR) repeat protein
MLLIRCTIVLTAIFVATGCASTPESAPPSPTAAEPYYDLGGFHRAITAASPEAQTWFDRGLALCYAFNHEEAIRCFQRSLESDPDCAMAHWGVAYASGPNINNTEMDEAARALAWNAVIAAARAADATDVTDVERALIAAMGRRYSVSGGDRAELDRYYAEAMRAVYETHPDDPDVAALFAEALMVLRPWNHWSKDGVPAPETPEIVGVLEAGMSIRPDHPGLCHFYIHTMEASPDPSVALAAADWLRDSMPGAGHLVHMPSHIDVLVGHYDSVIIANQLAIQADEEFVRREGAMNFYTLYRVHNYHFLVYGAMFDGQSALALETARELVRQIPEELLHEWTDFLDAFVPTALHVLVRFGRWDDILAEPRPDERLPVTLAVWHYARGLAYAATGRVAEAEAERRAFVAARDRVPETSILFNNTSRDILGVAQAMLDGEIEYRKGRHVRAFGRLAEAVRRDDALNYDEPWGWMQPARHALGALLLEQGRVTQAEAVYREDLRRHPYNPWSLHGLAECLRRTGRTEEAVKVAAQLEEATKRADVAIDRSCYCRLVTEVAEE